MSICRLPIRHCIANAGKLGVNYGHYDDILCVIGLYWLITETDK